MADTDFHADFEQKGVDKRIGIDMANLSSNRSIELIALATNDTDCIPRDEICATFGLAGCAHHSTWISVPGLLAHSDFRRTIVWPT
jgi:hypothetical protein